MKWSKGRAAFIYTCSALSSAAWAVCVIKIIRMVV